MVGLASYFDQVLPQATASLRALDKTESLKHAAARAAVLPQACMYVGDEPRDIMAATAAGYGGKVAVATGPATFGFLRDHPEHRPDHVLGRWANCSTLSTASAAKTRPSGSRRKLIRVA
jgi:phosphoglycolate phosphatase-like HAD superfamily hydrolase